MKVALLLYRRVGEEVQASLAWVDPVAGQVLNLLAVPVSPNLGVFPEYDSVLISYAEYSHEGAPQQYLDVYRLSDWCLRSHLQMDCRAHFNVNPEWTTFLASPTNHLIYLYKARTLGRHWAEDFVCGIDLAALEFTSWNFRIPQCVAGWSRAAGRAHAQMLFVADGLEVGKLPSRDLMQKVAFWLGPEDGMGPTIEIGPRPLSHSDLGHARAVLCARNRPLSVVVCNDGLAHLIDPVEFHYLESQQVKLARDHAMPLFAAEIEPQGRALYVGTAGPEARHRGLIERVVVHDLDSGRRETEWVLEEPFSQMAMTQDGKYLCGASPKSNRLWILEARNGEPAAVMQLDGFVQYVIPALT
jgi:hypothetical protein